MFDRVLNTTQMGDIFRNEKYPMVHWLVDIESASVIMLWVFDFFLEEMFKVVSQ